MAITQAQRAELAQLIRWINDKGWSPGTSTNYSFLHPANDGRIVISKSGVDKTYFSENDFLVIDSAGIPTSEYAGIKPSAETLIHCELYQLFPKTRYILHTHSLAGTVLSGKYEWEGALSLEGYEVLKGLPGIDTHDASIELPVFANDQDMERFRLVVREHAHRLTCNGFLMAKHGLYAWGESLHSAKRHLEIFEFLLSCELTQHQIRK
jgi:methylthioribulose-1-phosphate dehydratase